MPDIFGYENEKLNIIMLNMSTFYDWEHGISNRNLNILRSLEKNEQINKIIAVDFLPMNFRKAVKHYYQNILKQIRTSEIVFGDLTSACYQKTAKVFAYTTVDSIFSMNIVVKELKKIIKRMNLQNVIIWSYNPMFIDFIGRLDEKLFVFDTVDNWSEHPVYTKLLAKEKLLANYRKIAQEADVIFTVSEELLAFYEKMNRTHDVSWIPNGVDLEHFTNIENLEKENELTKIGKPIIGYLGTIQDRIDFDLIAEIAREHQDKIIALCGPVWATVQKEVDEKLKKFDNIIFTGRVALENAPSYITQFSVAIIPHKIDAFIKSTNPMKMYEYLACGKPIVSTEGAGIDMFSDFIYIAKNNSQFIQYIEQAISDDSFGKQSLRKEILKEHTWEKRTERMMLEINEN
ncbi:glycosyltransferase [bacterium]|nr:glycosyltransferase [bacterium]